MNDDWLLRKMSVGDVLDYSIEIFRMNFKQLILLALIFYVPVMVLYTAGASYLSSELVNFIKPDTTASGMEDILSQMTRLMAFYLAMGFLSLLYFIYSITLKPVMDAAIIRITHSHVLNKSIPDNRTLIKESFRKLVPLMINRLLYGLIVLGVSMVAVFVIYIFLFILILGTLFAAGNNMGSGPSTARLIIIGILFIGAILAVALVIGYFMVKFLFGEQAVVLDSKSGVNALSRSSELTKGCFWHTGISYLLAWFLFFLLPQLLASASYFLVYINKELYIAGTTLAQVINSVFYPFIVVLTTVLYINLKIKKEGYDLEQKVDILLESRKKPENPITDGE